MFLPYYVTCMISSIILGLKNIMNPTSTGYPILQIEYTAFLMYDIIYDLLLFTCSCRISVDPAPAQRAVQTMVGMSVMLT